jgi:hypothetical protein
MDAVLSSLFPIHQIGSDGFNWWVGQIESNRDDDPKKSGRYKVRIVGQHLKDCYSTASKDLPWANVMMPVTVPFTDGGTTGGSVNLQLGNWVIGFYLDNDKQKPIIMGSIGHTAGATLAKNVEKDPNPNSTCKSFTTFLDPKANPYQHSPLPQSEVQGGDPTKDQTEYTKVGQAGLPAAATDTPPAIFYGLFAENTATNPTGSKICVEIANPKCGSESDLKGGLSNILGGMLAANQQSGGQLGDYYVSKVNGELTRYIDNGMEYVNKAIRLVTSFLNRIKGEIVKLIREGVDKLVQLLLTEDAVTPDELGNVNTGPVNPDLGIKPFTPITKKQSRLKPIFDIINKVLEDLGCSIADITDKIAQWLTDLLLGYLMDAYNAAACLVDTLVDGIINQILSLLEDLISSVLGPIQELLSILADPLNIIGSAINAVFSLLGISCDGPSSQCEKVTKECTDCGFDKKSDWLDDLIAQLENGPSASGSVCEEATTYQQQKTTEVTTIGGIFTPDTSSQPGTSQPGTVSRSNLISYQCSDIITVEGNDAVFTVLRYGNTTVSSSVGYTTTNGTAIEGTDFISSTSTGTLGFAPGETSKKITYKTLKDNLVESTENFFIKLSVGVTPTGMVTIFPDGKEFRCEILDYTLSNLAPGQSPTTTTPPSTTTQPPFTIPYSIPTAPPVNTNTAPVVSQPIKLSPIPLVKTYNIVPDKTFYQEGEIITYTITTTNVTDDTILFYTISGTDITSSDIQQGLTGQFTVTNNTAKVQINLLVNDDIVGIDADETLDFSIDGTNSTASVLILGQSTSTPYYSVTADKLTVDEGETIIYTIKTLNVSDGTVLNYTLSGDIITSSDIDGLNLTGSFTIQNNTASVSIKINEDLSVESADLLTFSIDNTIASVDVIINAQSEEVTTPIDGPTYTVTSDKLEYNEGDTVSYTVSTTQVPDGTVLQYTLFGSNITPEDITGNSLFGSFIIINGQAKIYIGLNEDLTLENNETLTFIINGTNASADVIILSTDTESEVPEIIPYTPCINPPTMGAPITDDTGAIISIPIKDKGCPYQLPPKIIITGSGYGASAIALLNADGYVSEIRVTRAGKGYKKRTSLDANLSCVIDSFTLLNPGRDYTTEPEVYVNGTPNLARARINERGFVYSVEIIDRLTKYTKLPTITISGGGGSGARVIPSLACLDIADLERNGYAKIGTGKYIDCP